MKRVLVPAIAAALLALFAVLHACDRSLYFALLDAIHEHPFRFPFLDTRFVTAQVQCWQRGVDVYAANPCDPLHRTQDYSPLWLRLPFLALGAGWTPVLGCFLALLFVGTLFLLPLPLAGLFGSVVTLASVFSWSTIFAVERGNTDLLMFTAAAVFAHLLIRSAPLRTGGYALVLAAGLLKFYPLAMLAVAVREPGRRFWPVFGAGAAVLLLFGVELHAELARVGANMACGFFEGMFGARSLPFGLLLLRRPLPMSPDAAASVAQPASALLVAMAAACLCVAVLRGRDRALRADLDRIGAVERSLLLTGAVLCAGCFFGHQNIGYRATLLLLVLPGLLGLVRATTTSVYRVTSMLVVVVLWSGVIDGTFGGWLAVQLAWWWIVSILLSVAWSLLAQTRPGTRPIGSVSRGLRPLAGLGRAQPFLPWKRS